MNKKFLFSMICAFLLSTPSHTMRKSLSSTLFFQQPNKKNQYEKIQALEKMLSILECTVKKTIAEQKSKLSTASCKELNLFFTQIVGLDKRTRRLSYGPTKSLRDDIAAHKNKENEEFFFSLIERMRLICRTLNKQISDISVASNKIAQQENYEFEQFPYNGVTSEKEAIRRLMNTDKK